MSRISTILSLVALGSACVATPVDRTERFAGDVPPCDAVLRGAPTEGVVRERAELWEPGPWPVWNTHPGEGCNDNPVMPIGPRRRLVAVTGAEADLVYEDVQLYVTYPADSDPSVTGFADVAAERFPVIVFAHANNDRTCQIFESYYSLHDHWASWGFVVAAVDQTPFNCNDGNRTNVQMRARGIAAALDYLRELDADPASRFHERLDLDRVVFAGHSRGAAAASLAARARDDVLGIILLQGVDLAAFGFGEDHPTALPVLGITAGNDVDLHYPRVEPTEDRLEGPYTWVNINGGVHAYTADTVALEFDDRPGVSRRNQHDVTNLYTTAFLLHVTGDAAHDSVLFSLEGNALAAALSGNGVYQRWRADVPALWLDRFDRVDPDRNDLDADVVTDGFLRAEEVHTYAPDDPSPSIRWRAATSLLLSSAGPAVYETEVPGGAGGMHRLTFRAKGPDFGPIAPLEVELVYADQATAVPITDEHRGPLPFANRFEQVVVSVPRPERLRAVRFRIPGGALMIDDLRLE